MNIVRPDLVLGLLARDDDVGGTAVAPVEDNDAMAFAGQRRARVRCR
jgi:hypothetical protein